jgi:hypothetical protein
MGYQSERDEFLSIMGAEGVNVTTARTLLREASTLQKLAELSCSSEAADRDRVKCPAKPDRLGVWPVSCLCRDYGSYDTEGGASDEGERHGTVPRIAVKEDRIARRLEKLCAAHGLKAVFGGDPRGYVFLVEVPSGKKTDWGQRGVGVPGRGFTAAQMDRISR